MVDKYRALESARYFVMQVGTELRRHGVAMKDYDVEHLGHSGYKSACCQSDPSFIVGKIRIEPFNYVERYGEVKWRVEFYGKTPLEKALQRSAIEHVFGHDKKITRWGESKEIEPLTWWERYIDRVEISSLSPEKLAEMLYDTVKYYQHLRGVYGQLLNGCVQETFEEETIEKINELSEKIYGR